MASLKIWVRDIVEGEYISSESEYGGILRLPDGRETSRVRILGTVVDSYAAEDGNYVTLTIDDSTETIRLKFFKERAGKAAVFKTGDIIDALGDVREYDGEVYVQPFAFQKVDINWEFLRKIEMLKPGAGSQKPEAEKKVEDYKKIVLDKLAELDTGKGAKLEDLIKSLEDIEETDVLTTVRDLMMKGDLFEPKKGVLKIV